MIFEDKYGLIVFCPQLKARLPSLLKLIFENLFYMNICIFVLLYTININMKFKQSRTTKTNVNSTHNFDAGSPSPDEELPKVVGTRV